MSHPTFQKIFRILYNNIIPIDGAGPITWYYRYEERKEREKQYESDNFKRQSPQEGKLQQGMRGKVAAAFTVQRRVGAVSTLDEIYHYMMCSEMVIATSKGENMMFGLDPGDVMKDEEGQELLSTLAKNMAWLIKSICAKTGKE